MADALPGAARDRLVRTCRTAVGDELRSVTYFTRNEYDHAYLRDDLERGEEPQAFVEAEREGFTSQRTYEWSELGDYQYNIRVFERGYIVRVVNEERGAYVTTEGLTMRSFDELADAVGDVLDGIEA